MKSVGQMATTAIMLLVIVWFAPGCGGSGSSSSGPISSSTVTVNGVANLGVVRGGVVKAYRLDGGSKGALLDSYAATDIYGQYQLNITNYQGPMLLELTPDANNAAQFLDEYTGTMQVLTSTVRAVVPAPSADQYANITALTEVATLAALQKLAVTGTDPAQGVMEALAQVGTAFLGGNDPLTLRPDDVSQNSSIDAYSSHYASVLAGFSGLAANNKVTIAQLAADFYGQMFPQVGTPYGQASPYTDALYAQMQAVTTNAGVVLIPVATAKPLGTADIVAAHQGVFDFVRLTLSSVNGSDDLSVGSMDFYASVASALATTITEQATYRKGVATTVAGVVNNYGSAQQDGTWQLRATTSTTSNLFQQGTISGDGQWMAGVTTDIQNVLSHNLLLAVAHPAATVAASAMVGSWQWIAVEKNGTATVTWSGELTIVSAGFTGGVTFSNQLSAGRSSISGKIAVDSYSGFVLTNDSVFNAYMPHSFHLLPTADANKALVYFSDGSNWGVGVALRRNTAVQPLSGHLYHFTALDMKGKQSIAATANLLKGTLSGKSFTSAAAKPVTLNSSFGITWPTANSNGAQPVTVVQAGLSLLGYIATDGTVIVVEDPGKGIRLLLRQ